MSPRRVYLGLFLIALTTLAVQIILTRLMSYITWYHLAFFSISTCMLGMTAGAIRVYLRPDPRGAALSRDALRFGLATGVTVVFLCLAPVQQPSDSLIMMPMLLAATVVMASPFYYAGAVVAQVLSLVDFPTGRLYASDLFGAALGCLFALAAMSLVDVPSLLLVCAGLAALAGRLFSRSRTALAAGVILLAAGGVNATLDPHWLRPHYTKTHEAPAPEILARSQWNSFSHVAVMKPNIGPPFYWGGARNAPDGEVESRWLVIDGIAGTPMHPFRHNGEVQFLAYDITNTAHFLRPRGHAAIIGVGGGRDVQSALLFGHEKVTGIEVNPIIVAALRTEYAGYAGLAHHPAVNLVLDDGRSFMARSRERFALIQMSMVDTWAATGAGAFSLSENGLYTTEAWRIFLERLEEDGLFTVSRWHNPVFLGETGRMVSVAMNALFDLGVKEPAAHLAMLTHRNISTLIMGRQPLAPSDLSTLLQTARYHGYQVAFMPGATPDHALLARLLGAPDKTTLLRLAAAPEAPFNVMPATDDSPFFFNMLKPGAVLEFLRMRSPDGLASPQAGVVAGNLHAEFTLLILIGCALLIAILTCILPLMLAGRGQALKQDGFLPSAVFFSMIGLGFMFVEIGLMQRLSGFLGHPIYALAILLFSIILSTGLGSLASDRIRADTVRKIALALPPMLLALPLLLAQMTVALETAGLPARIGATLLVTLPFGILMGMLFPTGLRLTRRLGFADTAWFWSLNGVFGTLASGVAVYNSIHFGISATLVIAACGYALAALALLRMAGLASRPGRS